MRSNWAPWYIIAWRLIWWVPAMASRSLFVLIVLIMYGRRMAAQVLEDTR